MGGWGGGGVAAWEDELVVTGGSIYCRVKSKDSGCAFTWPGWSSAVVYYSVKRGLSPVSSSILCLFTGDCVCVSEFISGIPSGLTSTK